MTQQLQSEKVAIIGKFLAELVYPTLKFPQDNSGVLNPEEAHQPAVESGQRGEHLKLGNKAVLKKFKPFDPAINSLIQIVPNKIFEEPNIKDRAAYTVVFNTDSIKDLQAIDWSQRMIEAGFENQIVQLCVFEKHQCKKYRNEDKKMLNEFRSQKTQLLELIQEAETNIGQIKALAKPGTKSPKAIGKQRVEAKQKVKVEPNQQMDTGASQGSM